MRLTVSLIVLLIVAATSLSIVWRNLGASGDAAVVALASGTAMLVSLGLLARIVVKTTPSRRGIREDQP